MGVLDVNNLKKEFGSDLLFSDVTFTLNPFDNAVRTTARIAAFIPGASPPLVRTPIVFNFRTSITHNVLLNLVNYITVIQIKQE